LVFSPFNHLTELVAWEYFIVQCRHESYRLCSEWVLLEQFWNGLSCVEQ
jgi:hypothetical protein